MGNDEIRINALLCIFIATSKTFFLTCNYFQAPPNEQTNCDLNSKPVRFGETGKIFSTQTS